MNIGKRLHELRVAKGFSQGDIEHRTDLLRCYVSRVENGHTVPSLETLEKYAKTLDVELYQLFYTGKPEPPQGVDRPPLAPKEHALLKVLKQMTYPEQSLLLDMARKMASMERRKSATARK